MKKILERWVGIISGKLDKEKFRTNILQALPYWIASLITGLVAVFYAKIFAIAEAFSINTFKAYHWSVFIITPACFVLSWWIVKKYAPNAKGSGIPQVMSAIELSTPKTNRLVHHLLSLKICIVKIVSSMIMILGGGAIGREGPTIQIAGSIFRVVNQVIPNSWPKLSRRNMIMTGAAAGLAAAFNTPLGGIVFAVEELVKTHISLFKTAIFTAVIIAGITAQGILGSYLYLGYPDISNPSAYIFLFVIIVALLAGLGGSIISKIILKILTWKRNFKSSWFEITYVLSCGVIIAFIAYAGYYNILGSGKIDMTELLFSRNKYGGWELPIVRMIGPVFSFTTGAAGGIFAPALSAGAAIGSLVAEWFHLAAVNANVLILAGMVAFLTGVTRSPFTCAILVLEMTDRHSATFLLLLAAMIASLISTSVDKKSLYEHLKEGYIEDVLSKEPVTKSDE